MDRYREMAERLLAQGDAYPCFCTPEELEERRRAASERKEPPPNDRCRDLSAAERRTFEAEGRPSAIRFRMPEREWVTRDLVKGEVRWAPGHLKDFVLMRSDGSPVFLLAVAVDDMLMGVTHVIRGDDLLDSAPRNAAVIQALGGAPPAYAHVPQVNGPDGRPLSKRHGSTSVEAFREKGFLPEALMNYLALLGWSRDAETTLVSKEELVEAFDVERVSRNPARFDTDKLEWIDDDDLASRCLHFLSAAGLSPEPALLRRAMPLVRERMKRLTQSVELLRFLFSDDVVPDDRARADIAKAPEGYLRSVAEGLAEIDPWAVDAISSRLEALAAAGGLNKRKGFAPVRAAVTGSTISPPLPESLELLGREQTVERLRRFS
jgi:glutamyl-tRNA synthetase